MAQEMGHLFVGPGPEPLVQAVEAAGNEPTMRAGLQAATKPPVPPAGWESGAVGAHPGAQIHHEGKIHNPHADMTIEMPPAGGVEKAPIEPAAPKERLDRA